jgi:hypothetical protein
VSPVKYELGFYIPEDDILHSDRRENLVACCLSPVFTLVSYWGCSILKMEAEQSSETSVSLCQSRVREVPEDSAVT